MSDWVIECEALTKDYGRKRAVWDLNLRIPRGCVYGLLGRNGCGKTTTIKLLLGLLRPTRGACRVFGHSSTELPDEIRARIGYLVEGHPLYRTWRIRQLAEFTQAVSPRWDPVLFRETMRRFEIDPAARIWTLSRGQRGMIALSLVLCAGPELLILDDPSMGLDAVIRHKFLETMIEIIQTEGRTILFASHHLADVERVADRIGIMERGVLRVDCPTDRFTERVRKVEFAFEGEPSQLDGFPGLLEIQRRGPRTTMTVANFDDEKRDRLKELSVEGFEELSLNLEDAFVAYAGRSPSQAVVGKGE